MSFHRWQRASTSGLAQSFQCCRGIHRLRGIEVKEKQVVVPTRLAGACCDRDFPDLVAKHRIFEEASSNLPPEVPSAFGTEGEVVILARIIPAITRVIIRL